MYLLRHIIWKSYSQNSLPLKNSFIGAMDVSSIIGKLYSFLILIVGPLSVYVCALNRTFLLVGWLACLVRT